MSLRPQSLTGIGFPLEELSSVFADLDLGQKLESIPLMVQRVWSDDPIFQLEATSQFRKLLSTGERSLPIDEVINAGVIARFVDFLGRNDAPQLQFEAAYALTNVAYGTSEHTKVVIEHGAVPMFVQLLSSASDDVREQAVWALGNIAGDSPSCRDLVLSHGALVPLLGQLNERSKLSMLRTATWTLSNFCRGKPPTPLEQVKPALPVLCQLLHLQDEEVLTDVCWALSYLSDGSNDKIQAVIEAGVCQRLVQLLLHPSPTVLLPALTTVGNLITGDDIQTQYEAAWPDVASGTSEHTKVVIEHGAIPVLVQLLSSASDDVREQALRALGIVAGDSPSCRDLVLSHNALVPLLGQLNERSKLSMLRLVTWTLYNLCGGKPPRPFEQVKPALPVLCQLLHLQDEVVLTYVCWALSYLSDGPNDNIQAVIEAGVSQRLVQLLLHPSPTVLIPALKMVGNIVLYSGDDSQIQFIIDNQVLPCLFRLLTQPHQRNIKEEACWIVSNITARTTTQIQAVIDANIILPLVQLLQTAELDIKEAARAISYAACRGSHEQIQFLVRQGCIKPLCDLLISLDCQIVSVCLDGLENILKEGEADKESGLTNGINPYAEIIGECEGLYKIQSLRIHANENYDKAVKILERYWAEEDDLEEMVPRWLVDEMDQRWLVDEMVQRFLGT